jgi:hypothetical protein
LDIFEPKNFRKKIKAHGDVDLMGLNFYIVLPYCKLSAYTARINPILLDLKNQSFIWWSKGNIFAVI